MKAKLTICVILSLSILWGCDDGDGRLSQYNKDNEYVNNWIYDNMSYYYLWNEHIPSKDRLNFIAVPNAFFESLLYKYKKPDGDRFSWIENNYLDLMNMLSGVSRDIGFEYIPYYAEGSDYLVEFDVAYIKKNTSAEKQGLKRGDIIWKVDGKELNEDNYYNILYSGKASYKLTVYDPVANSDKELTITVENNYKEDPIYYSNIYETGGKKIGYIVYNFFAPDSGDDSYSYDIALAKLFDDFKTQGITDLILDLRYNPGGYLSSAVNIASAIVPQRSTGKIFTYDEHNREFQKYLIDKYGAEYVKSFFQEKITTPKGISQPIPELGINSLYVITTGRTASASETIINGLKPYMTVKTVGKLTTGKNVGSYTLYKENDSRIKYGLQPIMFQVFNSAGKSDYSGGFAPDIEVNEYDYYFDPLGNTNEIMLANAIADITGIPLKKSKSTLPAKTVLPGSSIERRAGANLMLKKVDPGFLIKE